MDGTENQVYEQSAPYPEILADLVDRLTYKPGWAIWLSNIHRSSDGLESGLTLVIRIQCYDTQNVQAGETYRVLHYMPVPPATYNEQSWRRWLLEQLLLVERHEACEFFQIDGLRPYNPRHASGNDPYTIFETDQSTSPPPQSVSTPTSPPARKSLPLIHG